MPLEIAQLRAFIAVAEHGSFSDAAAALYLSQPAVSKRINALETQLDRQLFDRMGKQVLLSPTGQALLPSARRVLAELAQCEAELLCLDGRVAGQLALGTSHHIGLRHLPTLLRHYISTYPDVQIDLQLYESEDALTRVSDNSLELAVVTLPAASPKGLICECLWTDPLLFYASPDHPLVGAAELSPRILCQHTALLPTRATATRRLLEQQLVPYGLQLGQVLETNYLETNKGLAEAGLGWTLLPQNMVDNTLSELPIRGLNLCRELGVVRRAGRTLSAAANAMLELLHQERSQPASHQQ